MRFLKLRTAKTTPRKDGTFPIYPLVVDSPRKYAPSSARTETVLSLKKCQLITGAHDSGKTRWLNRLHSQWRGIWGAKIKAEPIYLSALRPLSTWTEHAEAAQWYDNYQHSLAEKAHSAGEHFRLRLWDSLSQQERADRLTDYVTSKNCLVFVDDAHKLTGRKLQVARECIISARVWVITASQENRLPPNLRTIIERREPQRTVLKSDASYDASGLLVWGLIVAALLMGWWEASFVLGGLKLLGRGRTSTRDD